MSPGQRADVAILVECIADAAQEAADRGNTETAHRLARYAGVVLGVDARIQRAWAEEDWAFAAARASSDAVAAARACS